MSITVPAIVIGQIEAIRVLQAIAPAHVLLIGNPGLGKTHLARWYLHHLVGENGDYCVADGGKLNEASGLGYIYARPSNYTLDNFPGPVLVDEVQEVENITQFYPLLTPPTMPQPRTWVFTTTDEGDLPPAFLSRLRIVALKPYSLEELAQIAGLQAKQLPYQTRLAVAKLSWGSPRQVIALSTLVQEVGQEHNRIVQPHEVYGVMKHLGYEMGLNMREVELLKALRNGPRSISTLSALMGTGGKTIRLWETELVYAGLMTISSRGRDLTDKGRRLLAQLGKSSGQTSGENTVEKME